MNRIYNNPLQSIHFNQQFIQNDILQCSDVDKTLIF